MAVGGIGGTGHWSVIDQAYRRHREADAFLLHLRFAADAAEGTAQTRIDGYCLSAYCAIVLACMTSAVLPCARSPRDRIGRIGRIASSRWLVLR